MPLFGRNSLAILGAAVLAAGMAACGGEDDPGDPLEPLEPTLSSIEDNVFAQGCAFSACHDSSGPAQQLEAERRRSDQTQKLDN